MTAAKQTRLNVIVVIVDNFISALDIVVENVTHDINSSLSSISKATRRDEKDNRDEKDDRERVIAAVTAS